MIRNRIYYRIKPVIPPSVRLLARRWLALTQRSRIKSVWPILPGSEEPPVGWPGWPDGKRFAFVLTHDVEGQSGLHKCLQLMRLEMKHGFRSSFNFIPEGEYRVPASFRAELAANGFEVGVHDLHHDGKLYFNRQHFAEKAARINHYLKEWGAVGFRSGFMLRKLEWLHDLNIEYDASTFDTDPFEPQPDGAKTIFPFWVENTRGRGYVELPYTLVQDSNLFLVLKERSPAVWKKKLDWIAANRGMALVIVHPDYMNFTRDRCAKTEFPSSAYEEFLAYVKTEYSGQYWQALPREVASYVHASWKNAASVSGKNGNGHASESRISLRTESAPTEALTAATARQFQPARDPLETPAVTCRREGSQQDLASVAELSGKRAAVVLFSYYPNDPRPRRAAEALIKEGMLVDLICLRESDKEPLREIFNGVSILRIPFKRRRGGKVGYIFQYTSFILLSFLILAFRSVTRRYRLVHVHNMPDVLVFSALVPRMLGAKVILDLHDPMPELMMTIFNLRPESAAVRMMKRLEKYSIGFADTVLTVNAACKKIFISRSGGAGKIGVIMNSPDESIFALRPLRSRAFSSRDAAKPFVLMYHGSLVERHGLDIAVRALELVRQSVPTAQLRIYGNSTPFLERVMQSLEGKEIEQAVHYFGPKNLEEIVEAIADCDAGIIPNRRSIFTEINTPTRIFEYLSRGKPVIAPRAPGIQDYFGENDIFFFELGDAKDLAKQIEHVFENPLQADEVVRRGQKIYFTHTWSQEKASFVSAVKKLVLGKTGEPPGSNGAGPVPDLEPIEEVVAGR